TGARNRGIGLERLAEWMATAPARVFGLGDRKGVIAPGRDADLVVFDAEATTIVDARALEHRHAVTLYDGLTLCGRVESTWLRGRRVFRDGGFTAGPSGRTLMAAGHR